MAPSVRFWACHVSPGDRQRPGQYTKDLAYKRGSFVGHEFGDYLSKLVIAAQRHPRGCKSSWR